MKKVIYLALLAMLFSACSNSDEPGSITRAYYENQDISISDNPGVYVNWEEGDKTIFRFGFQHPDEPNVADDELTEFFYIEIPSNINSFEIDSFERGVSAIEVFYVRSCFCYFDGAFDISNLLVTGNKVSNDTWQISFRMTATGEYGSYELSDNGTYSLQVLEFGP